MIAPEWVSVSLRVAFVVPVVLAIAAVIGEMLHRRSGDLRISMKGVQELERRERRAKEQDRR